MRALIALVILAVGICGVQGASAVELGLRVPLAGLASVPLSEDLRLEASAAIPGFSAPLVDFEGRVVAKLYPELELAAGGLELRPFVGGGVAMLQALGEWVPALVGVAGVEAPAPELPLTLFIEGGAALLSHASPTLVFELGMGARFALP